MTPTVGIPKEIKPQERRVGLTPKGVKVLHASGCRVLVEEGAGFHSGYSDEDYLQAGAKIVLKASELWKHSDVIKKVKEPLGDEIKFLREGQIVFTFLHLAAPESKDLVHALIKSKAIGVSYETIDVLGYTPILKPMSLIAGSVCGYLTGVYHQMVKVKKDNIQYDSNVANVINEYADRYPELPQFYNPGKVVVMGGGQVGIKVAEIAQRMGGEVTIIEKNTKRGRYLSRYFDRQVKVLDKREEALKDLTQTDTIVGAVYLRGARAPVLIDSAELKDLSKSKKRLIFDVSADQGGNIAGSELTTWENPLRVDEYGNLRFGVCNIPSFCPKYASEALEEVTLDYLLALTQGLVVAIYKYPELVSGIATYQSNLCQKEVASAHGLSHTPLKLS